MIVAPTPWACDFEFAEADGENPQPWCFVAANVQTGQTVRQWLPHCRDYQLPANITLLAYAATAELRCFQVLGWPRPAAVIDLHVEFKRHLAGAKAICGENLIGALAHFGLPGLDDAFKAQMRELAVRGAPYSDTEAAQLLDYCEKDVLALVRLFARMLPEIDAERAMLRGQYLMALAVIESRGVPIDGTTLGTLKREWSLIRGELIRGVDQHFDVFTDGKFNAELFERWLTHRGIVWPRTPTGRLETNKETFKAMAQAYPSLQPLKELLATLGEFNLANLTIGSDGRNRLHLRPFASKTGRNQPSSTKYIFGPAVWIRNLIKPTPGYALGYIDFEQQEFGIAGRLSGDKNMIAAYESGDPYLAFGVQAGAIPPGATKSSHKSERELFKLCALGVQYGMGAEALGVRIGKTTAHGRHLLELHKRAYPEYWAWSDAVENHALFGLPLISAFGWQVKAGLEPNPRSLRNFPLQANGAEMLRMACIRAEEVGVRIIAPVHDAVLIEAGLDEIEDAVEQCRRAMAKASSDVLPGFELRTEAKIFRYPDHFTDPRGARIWQVINEYLQQKGSTRETRLVPPTDTWSHLIISLVVQQ